MWHMWNFKSDNGVWYFTSKISNTTLAVFANGVLEVTSQ